MIRRWLPVFAVLCFAGTAGAVDLVFNGGFEDGIDDDADGWEEGVIGEGTTLVREAGAGVGGSVAMFGKVDYVSGTGTKTELRQSTGPGSVIPGEEYTLSFQAKGLMGVGGVAWYDLFWYDSNGDFLEKTALGNLWQGLTESYQEFGDVYTAPDDADSVEISIRLEGGAFEGSSGELYVDDVVLDGKTLIDPGVEGELNFRVRRDGDLLVFSWSSQVGKVYDLLGSESMEGNPREWDLVVGDIEATPRTNVESIGMLEGRDEFFVLVERSR